MASSSGQEDESEVGSYSETFMRTLLYEVILSKDSNRLLSCLQSGENVRIVDNEGGSTCLHLLMHMAHGACEANVIPMVYMLSNAGVDVNAEDIEGRTALHFAIQKELVDTISALIRVGVDTTLRDYKQLIRSQGSPFEFEMLDMLDKYEPGLWAAVAQNNTSLVHMLLNSWCRLNIHKNGITLLEFARGTGKSAELCDLIEDYEVSLEFVHATLAGDEKRMLEFLMDSKPCDPSMMDISYQERWCMPLQPRSLRDTAIAMGHTHVLHLLPEDDESSVGTIVPRADPSQCSDDSDSSSGTSDIVTTEAPQEKDCNHNADTWREFCFHPDSYLHMPTASTIRIGGKSLAGRSQHYKVNWEEEGKSLGPRSKNRSIRSKLCVIS